MSRSYEDAGGGHTRKWQCFVCGSVHETYEGFRSHIVLDHAQGREYLSCPACDAPVRDLTSHFKVKHPQRPLPTGIQMRATLWYDFAPNGKRKARKPKFRKGQYESKKSGKLITYKSGYEADILNYLDMDPDVRTFDYEPFKIPYCIGGEWHNYFPDLKVEFIDNTIEVWEIKPDSQREDPVNQAKWAAAYNFCENLGFKFNLITENGINKLRQKVFRKPS